MKSNLTYAIVTIMFMSIVSCSSYDNISVSLEQAVDKGKVRTTTNRGKTTYFDNIEFENNNYYGVKGNNRVMINDLAIPEVYLSVLVKTNSYRIWVRSINANSKIEGYLYAINDSSILVSKNLSLQDPEELTSLTELKISDIKSIKTREKGKVGRGYLKGTFIAMGIGGATGLVLGAASEVGSGFTLAMMGAGAGLIGPIGSFVGLAMGSSKDTYIINGDQATYELYKAELMQQCFSDE